MFCARCGQQIPDATEICPLCGRQAVYQLHLAASPGAGETAPAGIVSPQIFSDYDSGLRRVRGWLLVFCVIATILTPLGNLRNLELSLHSRWGQFDLLLVVFSLLVGIQVWRVAPSALTWVKAYFISLAIWEVLRIALFLVLNPHVELQLPLILRVRTLVWVAIWTAYFWKSERVRATFGRNLF